MENQVQSTPRLLDVIKEFLSNEASENNLSDHTIEKHGYQMQNLQWFLMSIGQLDIKVNEIKIRHMELFKHWIFKNTPTKSHNHVSRHLRLCRNACDMAVRMELMDYNNLSSMKLKRDKIKTVISCDALEISRFESYVPIRKSWQLILDAFLFQCYTGISFMDLWLFELKEDEIVLLNGDKMPVTWITCPTGRGKTKRLYWAEFIPEARDIYNKYEGLFPKIWNQTYNRIIRKIANELGMGKWLTTHVGRKTFATIMRKKGYSVPSIADMLGNTEEVARKHYIEMNKELIVLEMIRVKQLNQYNTRLAG